MTAPAESVPLLQLREIRKTYPGVVALDNAHFTLLSGQIHALLGANGAGKTTLVKIIAGVEPADSGSIILKGQQLRLHRVRDASEHGIVVVHQERTLIRHLTVAQNIMLGMEPTRVGIIQSGDLRRQACELLERFEVDLDLDTPVQYLGAGKQQLVDIVRALRTSPHVIVLDEPTAALSAGETEHLFEMLRRFKAHGVGIIFVSHRLDEVFEIADYITILRDGRVVSEGAIASYTQSDIPRWMVGSELADTSFTHERANHSQPLLETRDLCGAGYQQVSLTLHAGEIIGLAGTVGAGRTEFLESLIGFQRCASGEIRLRGQPFQPKTPREAIRRGVVLVPDKRMEKGLMMGLSVYENLSIASVENHTRFGWLDGQALRDVARRTVDRLRIVTPGLQTSINSLSGGNKQKVVFGKWLAAIEQVEDRVFLFDEPTEGVDVGGRAEMWNMIRDLAKRGAGVIISTSDLDELMTLADQIYVLYRGKVVSSGDVGQYSDALVLQRMLGAVE